MAGTNTVADSHGGRQLCPLGVGWHRQGWATGQGAAGLPPTAAGVPSTVGSVLRPGVHWCPSPPEARAPAAAAERAGLY